MFVRFSLSLALLFFCGLKEKALKALTTYVWAGGLWCIELIKVASLFSPVLNRKAQALVFS